MNDKLGRKVTLREDSRFAKSRNPSNRTGLIGIPYEVDDFGEIWYRVRWVSGESNSYEEEDLLWYDYVDDWKDVVRSWGGSVDG